MSASFFEKLKKGMGIEESIEEEFKEEKPEIPKKIRVKKMAEEKLTPVLRVKKLCLNVKELREETAPPVEVSLIEEKKEVEKPELEEKKLSFAKASSFVKTSADKSAGKEKWSSFGQESVGQLAIDVYQTENDLVIQSAIAGVRAESLEVTMEKDIVTIKGMREKPSEEPGDYFSQECYWGLFSREIILPTEVDPNRAMAEMKNGILIIRIPKILREKKRKIVVRGS